MPPTTTSPARRTAVTIAATASATLAAALALPAPAQAVDGAAPALKVLTYNTFLMSTNLYPNWGQEHRAGAIAAAPFFRGHDAVVLTEAFDNASSRTLQAGAATQYPYQTPVVGRGTGGWDATGGSYSSTTPEDGGVTVLSKWPILRKEQFVFKEACGSDRYSNKGFAYAVLNVGGRKAHLVGTHTQSTDSGCGKGEAVAIRAKQFRAIDAFLKAKKIPADEQVMLAGDLNVDARSAEYAAMLGNSGFVGADARTGHPYSFDTKQNSIARYRYPDDAPEDLDYVLHRSGHARPASWRNTVVKAASAPWTVSSWGRKYTYTDLSDHYPLISGTGRE
ncbi:sphingomyelin phosphodiesterase [Streptomyces sp. AV19]|uniref:sphingomyelin phosphodiesterase n=1 Tax=Streptomyces sp. AV19 TaxID=2793068 RepID=UPI0018FEBDA5|nr:sphingomyelin phosphodiesterase [Streptomyces sp. AV19]MBH1935940.1 sphingomyelin phosphodiesterase [Streptomyces sp. AV19]MDG4534276.1 sphingomyelin phosphodiesterase [Streptomyces sp. AV19]